jgi:hypothetical protein
LYVPFITEVVHEQLSMDFFSDETQGISLIGSLDAQAFAVGEPSSQVQLTRKATRNSGKIFFVLIGISH